jgi:hypothetical protein
VKRRGGGLPPRAPPLGAPAHAPCRARSSPAWSSAMATSAASRSAASAFATGTSGGSSWGLGAPAGGFAACWLAGSSMQHKRLAVGARCPVPLLNGPCKGRRAEGLTPARPSSSAHRDLRAGLACCSWRLPGLLQPRLLLPGLPGACCSQAAPLHLHAAHLLLGPTMRSRRGSRCAPGSVLQLGGACCWLGPLLPRDPRQLEFQPSHLV